MDRLGIERLCVFDMPPDQFVRFAADLDCHHVGIALEPMRVYNPQGYPDWSLRKDADLRRRMKEAMDETGVAISIMEGLGIAPGVDERTFAADLDLLCELGGNRINLVSVEPDRGRTYDGFAIVAEMAGERGIEVTSEVGSMLSFPEGLEAVSHVARPNFKLLFDTMHFFRLGWKLEQFAQVDPAVVGYIQLCDAPWQGRFETYREEALFERLAPGAGELPLAQFVELLRPDVIVSLEIPQRSLAEAGLSPMERVRPCVDAARSLLARAS